MKICYIAGPYTPHGDPEEAYLEVERNIARAREAAARLAQNGVGFFCPHLNSAHMEVMAPNTNHDFWMAIDFRILAVCDGLLLLPGWQSSQGSKQELEEAKRLGLPVFGSVSDVLWAWVYPEMDTTVRRIPAQGGKLLQR
jgi:hypothetical protein